MLRTVPPEGLPHTVLSSVLLQDKSASVTPTEVQLYGLEPSFLTSGSTLVRCLYLVVSVGEQPYFFKKINASPFVDRRIASPGWPSELAIMHIADKAH